MCKILGFTIEVNSNFLANEFNANSYGYNGCNLTEHSGTVNKVIFCPV